MTQPITVLISGQFSPENQTLMRDAAPEADLRYYRASTHPRRRSSSKSRGK